MVVWTGKNQEKIEPRQFKIRWHLQNCYLSVCGAAPRHVQRVCFQHLKSDFLEAPLVRDPGCQTRSCYCMMCDADVCDNAPQESI